MATSTELLRRSGVEVVWAAPYKTLRTTKVTVTDIVAHGDFLTVTSGEVAVLDGISHDNAAFGGIAISESPGTNLAADEEVTVALEGVIRVKAGGAITAYQPVLISAGPTVAQKNAGTQVDYQVTGGTAANSIGWALESAVSGDTVLVYFSVPTNAAMFTSTGLTTITT